MKQKASLVLSGGGARGIAHIGVIEELERQGIEIVSVSGTSMGAVVGGIFASGQMEILKNWLYTLDKLKVFNLVDFSFSTQGLVKGDRLLNTMKEQISDSNIEDMRIPFAAVAADIINRKEVVFTNGPLFDAIRASIAIPTVFTPVKTADGLLVDGGVINNIPVNHVKRINNDILVVVNVNANTPAYKPVTSKNETIKKQSIYQKKINEFYNELHKIYPINNNEKLGYFDLINKTISLMTYQITQLSLHSYSPDLLIEVSRESCGTFDFYKAEELVEIGHYVAKKSIGEYEHTNK